MENVDWENVSACLHLKGKIAVLLSIMSVLGLPRKLNAPEMVCASITNAFACLDSLVKIVARLQNVLRTVVDMVFVRMVCVTVDHLSVALTVTRLTPVQMDAASVEYA
jgi:hypothetical protein